MYYRMVGIINKSILLIGVSLFLNFPIVAYAHEAGEQHFFTINNEIPLEHPLTSNGIQPTVFSIPQDISKSKYLVNELLYFKINAEVLVEQFGKEKIDKTTFYWDFGDGTTAEGIENSHRYINPGSYTLKIDAVSDKNSKDLIQSIQLDILPNNYNRVIDPEIVIKNGTKHEDGTVVLDFRNPIYFQAVSSEESFIDTYVWDFGDGTSAKGKSVTHKFKTSDTQYNVVLRTIDKNKIINDRSVLIINEVKTTTSAIPGYQTGMLILIIQGVIIIVIGLWFFIDNLKSRKVKRTK